ncbi:hypothetical protein [Enterobacter sp. RHBSTW-00175]|uniref:hypothetical protein n=1 Tax=Enterobacter sp. RHBSTW-00175 TaxID=2742639 RepID=UPI0015EAFA1E|nr:hypothetical protein [Enterobacter sp. RHBSTW-00175]QMR74838.1 hypothetical protein HV107_04055 [Enterobacter sp. RHBSTW-00175]
MAEYVFLILTCIVILGLILMFILMHVENNKFYIICDLYKKEFGTLPFEAKLFNTSSPFFIIGYNIKMNFIIIPLVFNMPSSLGLQDEKVKFIRGLPKELTNIFLMTFYLSVLMTIVFIALIIVAMTA